MSPHAGWILQEEVVPRLRSSIPRTVNYIGSEDSEELVQDATCMAARLMELHSQHPDWSFQMARRAAAAEMTAREPAIFSHYSLFEGHDRFDRLPQPDGNPFKPLHRELSPKLLVVDPPPLRPQRLPHIQRRQIAHDGQRLRPPRSALRQKLRNRIMVLLVGINNPFERPLDSLQRFIRRHRHVR